MATTLFESNKLVETLRHLTENYRKPYRYDQCRYGALLTGLKRYATYNHVRKVSCCISQTAQRWTQSVSYGESYERHVSTVGVFDHTRYSATCSRRSENVDAGSLPAAVFAQRQADSAARRRLQKTQ